MAGASAGGPPWLIDISQQVEEGFMLDGYVSRALQQGTCQTPQAFFLFLRLYMSLIER